MAWFKAKVHDAVVSDDGSMKTIPKDRMVNRAGAIKVALKNSAPVAKKEALKAELKKILEELGAREDAIYKILNDPKYKE